MVPADDEMKTLTARLDDHARQLQNMSLVLYGSEAMHMVGLAERLQKIEQMLGDLVSWQKDVKTLVKVGVLLLGTSTLGTLASAYPQLKFLLEMLGG